MIHPAVVRFAAACRSPAGRTVPLRTRPSATALYSALDNENAQDVATMMGTVTMIVCRRFPVGDSSRRAMGVVDGGGGRWQGAGLPCASCEQAKEAL